MNDQEKHLYELCDRVLFAADKAYDADSAEEEHEAISNLIVAAGQVRYILAKKYNG